MKKFIFILLAFIGVSFMANAQNSCTIYNADGATAMLLNKGGQADSKGWIYIPVQVNNYRKDSGKDRSVQVWIEVRDQDTRCVVARDWAGVQIKKFSHSGDGGVRVTGLQPGHDYLFNIDSAKSCD